MCGYHCPYAERKPCAGFLLCRALYRDGVNYNVRANAMSVICAFQKQCTRTGRMENTDSAKDCYAWRVKANADRSKAVIGDETEFIGENAPVDEEFSDAGAVVTTAVSGSSVVIGSKPSATRLLFISLAGIS